MPTRTKRPVTMSADPEPQPMVAIMLTDDIEDPPVPPGTIEEADPAPGTSQKQSGSTGTLEGSTVPSLPEGLLPLAHGFCQYLQAKLDKELTDAGIKMARVVETSVLDMSKFTQGVLATNEHAQYSFADALVKFAQVSQPLPYQMALQVRTPQGYPLTVTVQKANAEELIPAMVKLGEWMAAHGYTP